MTQNDIIRMAREACDKDKVEAWSNGFWTLTQEELERFADLVLKAERQACAELVQVHMTAASIDMGVAICVRGRK